MPTICHVEITKKDGMPRVLRAARSAQAAGWDVIIIGEGESCIVDGIPYIGFPPSHSRLKRMLVRSRKMVKAAAKTNADLIQLHSPELLLYLGKLKNKKIIFDSHEFYYQQIKQKKYIPAAFRTMISRIYLWVERCAIRKIDAVLFPCTLDGTLPSSTKSAKRCQVIANYSRQDIPEMDFPNKENAIVYAGSLTYDRGITILAQAACLAGVTLYLCGSFSSKAYEQEILSGPYSSCIRYLGVLDRNSLFNVYSRCKIGMSTLLPVGQYHHGDTMATKIFEYMQCGLPVICSSFPYTVRQNEAYHFGICVDPTDAEAIASAVKYLLDHPDAAYQMGENGRQALKEKFNWDVEEKKLLALYEDIYSEVK